MDPYPYLLGWDVSARTPNRCHLCVSGSCAASYETFWVGLQSFHETQWRMVWKSVNPLKNNLGKESYVGGKFGLLIAWLKEF